MNIKMIVYFTMRYYDHGFGFCRCCMRCNVILVSHVQSWGNYAMVTTENQLILLHTKCRIYFNTLIQQRNNNSFNLHPNTYIIAADID